MKKLLLYISFFIHYSIFSQISIGRLNPDPHAQLDVSAEKKGILIPNVTLQNKTSPEPISNDPNKLPKSLLVYNNGDNPNVVAGYYYWNKTKWNKIIIEDNLRALPKSPWNKEGTTDVAKLNTDNIYQKGNVGIGHTYDLPVTEKLDVNGNVRIRGLVFGSIIDDGVGVYSDGSLRRIPNPKLMNNIVKTYSNYDIPETLSDNIDVLIVTDIGTGQTILPQDPPIGKIIIIKKYGPANLTSNFKIFKNHNDSNNNNVFYQIWGHESVQLLYLGYGTWEVISKSVNLDH